MLFLFIILIYSQSFENIYFHSYFFYFLFFYLIDSSYRGEANTIFVIATRDLPADIFAAVTETIEGIFPWDITTTPRVTTLPLCKRWKVLVCTQAPRHIA